MNSAWDTSLRGTIPLPENLLPQAMPGQMSPPPAYPPDKPVATRKAYGNALERLALQHPSVVALDAEVSNSTYADIFRKACPERFFEMYVAEQNMAGAALGLRGVARFRSFRPLPLF
jgi:transketolase